MAHDERPPVHNSGRYWRTRTQEQLRHEIDGNMVGSPVYKGALAEFERREAEADRKSEMRWIKATFAATVILGLLGVAATLAS